MIMKLLGSKAQIDNGDFVLKMRNVNLNHWGNVLIFVLLTFMIETMDTPIVKEVMESHIQQ